MTDLAELSASDLSRLIAARKAAPSEVMAASLARITAAQSRPQCHRLAARHE